MEASDINAELADLIEQARQLGPERRYLDYLKTQPSAYSGHFSYDWDIGYFCEPAHYRTAKNSGTGCKPEFWAVPLTNAEHGRQHRVGTFVFAPREWWMKQIIIHLRRYIESA